MEIRVVLALVLSTQFAVTEFRKAAASSDSSAEKETQTRGEERKAPDKHPTDASLSVTDYSHVRSPSESLTESVRPFSSCSSGVFSQSAPDSSSPRSSTSSSTTKSSFHTAASCSRSTSTVYGSFSDSDDENSTSIVTPVLGGSTSSLRGWGSRRSSTESKQSRGTATKRSLSTTSTLSAPAFSAYKLTQHSSKESVGLQQSHAPSSDTGSSASSSLIHRRPKHYRIPGSDEVLPPAGKLSPTELPSERAIQEGSLGSEGAFIPRCTPTISCKRGTPSGFPLLQRMAARNPEQSRALLTVSDSNVEPSGHEEGTLARKPADITRACGHPVAAGPGEPCEKSRLFFDVVPLETSKKTRSLAALFRKGAFRIETQVKMDASRDEVQQHGTKHPMRSASFQLPRPLKYLTLPRRSGAPTHSASDPSSVVTSSTKPTSSSIRRSQSLIAPAKQFIFEERHTGQSSSKLLGLLSKRTASSVRLPRSKTSTEAGASETSSSDGVDEAQAAQQRAMEERAAQEKCLWEQMRHYEKACADIAVQKSLHALTDQVRELVDLMKTDARRAGPFFQDPEVCQSERPQMVCPYVLHHIGSRDIVALAEKGSPSLPFAEPGEQEKFVLESVVPTGKEIMFTSLVRGRSVILKKEALFVVAPPVHLMVMRDRLGQPWFLESVIVDCNRINEELLIHSEALRLEGIRKIREMSSLKINSIAKALALSSVDDILALNLEEAAAEQEESDKLYTVARFFKVKQPWITDLGSVASLLRKEAVEPQNQESVFRMRLNLTVQILAVVGSLDSLSILPRRFTMREFGLRSDGTILGLFSPAFQSLPKRSALLTKAASPHHSRFSLVNMLAALWCPEGLDVELLTTASDWQREPYFYFPKCVPKTPLEVKNLMVQLCSLQTTELYSMLREKDFNRLADMVRYAMQGSKRETKRDRRTERALRRRQARVKEAPA